MGSAGGLPGPPSQQRLGTWHLAPRMSSTGFGTAASSPAGAPLFSSCRSCESFTVRRGGGPGWAPPRGAGRPHPPVASWALGIYCGVRRGELGSSPRLWELAVLEKPWRPQRDIIRTNSGKGTGAGGDRQRQSGASTEHGRQGPSGSPLLRGCAARPPPPCVLVRQLWEGLQRPGKRRLSLQKREGVFWEERLLLGLGKRIGFHSRVSEMS